MSININIGGIREMSQQLRTLIALGEDVGSIPTTHMVVHNRL